VKVRPISEEGVIWPGGAPLLRDWQNFFRVPRESGAIAKDSSPDHIYGKPTTDPGVLKAGGFYLGADVPSRTVPDSGKEDFLETGADSIVPPETFRGITS